MRERERERERERKRERERERERENERKREREVGKGGRKNRNEMIRLLEKRLGVSTEQERSGYVAISVLFVTATGGDAAAVSLAHRVDRTSLVSCGLRPPSSDNFEFSAKVTAKLLKS